MRIIDLTLPVYDGMPVFPGDPEVSVRQIHTIAKEGWNLTRVEMNSHDGTHVDVPYHMVEKGRKLDEYNLADFFGTARIYEDDLKMSNEEGVIIKDRQLDRTLAQKIVEARPLFIGTSDEYEIDITIEKFLLEHHLILYERLVNLEKLPESFMFYGIPLSLKGGDGAPVRAFAVID